MRVWVVCEPGWEWNTVLGVYASKEAAEKAVEKFNETRTWASYPHEKRTIDAFEVDENPVCVGK